MAMLRNAGAAILLGLAAIGCSQKEESPHRVPFEEFSLTGTGCAWTELTYPHEEELVAINTPGELANYLTCSDDGAVPSIDFARGTLLLARGVAPYAHRFEIKELHYFGEQGYVMRLTVAASVAPVITNWQVAVVTPKLKEGEKIRLQIDESH